MSKINPQKTKLTRDIHTIPPDIQALLASSGVLDDYYKRPDYQQNDYVGWIEQAKQPATRQKRINQMIDELKTGGIYMNMQHAASRKQHRE